MIRVADAPQFVRRSPAKRPRPKLGPRSDMGRLEAALEKMAKRFAVAELQRARGELSESDRIRDQYHRQRRAIIERVRRMVRKAGK